MFFPYIFWSAEANVGTVVLESLVPVFFLLSSSFLHSFLFFPFLLLFINCFICSYHHGLKHCDKGPAVQDGVSLDQAAADGS